MGNNNNLVFISYSHKDKNIADAIVNHFESSGIKCWYAPRDIRPGEEWAQSIVEGIKKSKIMILVFTDFSNSSKQVKREVETAINNETVIIPFKLTEKNPEGSMEYYLSTLHWLDAIGKPMENSITELLQLTNSMLMGKSVPTISKQNKKDFRSFIKILVPLFLAATILFAIVFMREKSHQKEPETIDRKPVFDLSLVRKEDSLNTNGYLGGIAVRDESGDYVYYVKQDTGIFKCKYEDFAVDFDNGEDLNILTTANTLGYTNNHLIFSDFDYLHVYNLDTKEKTDLGIFNAGFYLGVGEWIIYVDKNDWTLKRITLDGKYSETFDGVTLRSDVTSYQVYKDSIFFVDNNNVLKEYKSDGTIEEVKIFVAGEDGSKKFAIRAEDFVIVDDFLFFNEAYEGTIWVYSIPDSVGYMIIDSVQKNIYPFQISVWANHGPYIVNIEDNEKTNCYGIVSNKNDPTNPFDVELITNTENFWYANTVGDYLYYRISGDDDSLREFYCIK